MMVSIIAVGRLKEDYLKTAWDRYISEIRKRIDIELIEIMDEPDPGEKNTKLLEEAKSREGSRILGMIPDDSCPVLLDPAGEILGVDKYIKSNQRNITFIIGGSNGFGKEVYKRVKDRISFSEMTFPHQLARILLLDGINRAF
jgi:23S rRNA (pseudouridine1915-N3)-methyltransferase